MPVLGLSHLLVVLKHRNLYILLRSWKGVAMTDSRRFYTIVILFTDRDGKLSALAGSFLIFYSR